MKAHILVTTNNFWVGGRETYAATYLGALARQDVTAELLCSNLQPGLPEATAFRTLTVAQGDDDGDRLRSWLDLGGRIVEERRPTLIWAHHFELLPAWLLAQRHGIPMLVTFHGPLFGAGRPNDALEALGMALAVHRGSLLSGVSPEVCANLELLTGHLPALLPNVVALGGGRPAAAQPAWPPRRWLLVTRQEKLGHLRATLRLFAAYRDRVPGARLVVVSSATPATGYAPAGVVGRIRRGLEILGYRWCRREGASMWRALTATHWVGYSAAPRTAMRESDLVLGMGRVVLEALAEGRPALLVGYEDIHGLVEDVRWDDLARSNFSGRGVPARDVAACVRDLTAPRPVAPPSTARFGATEAAEKLLELGSVSATQKQADRELAGELCRLLRDGADAGVLFALTASRLTEREWGSFFRLSRG